MTEIEHIFTCLSEECAEVIQEVTKIQRFGLNDTHPSKKNFIPNEQRLNQEINDIMGVVEMLQDRGIKIEVDENRILAKKEKVEKYMEYARTRGTLV